MDTSKRSSLELLCAAIAVLLDNPKTNQIMIRRVRKGSASPGEYQEQMAVHVYASGSYMIEGSNLVMEHEFIKDGRTIAEANPNWRDAILAPAEYKSKLTPEERERILGEQPSADEEREVYGAETETQDRKLSNKLFDDYSGRPPVHPFEIRVAIGANTSEFVSETMRALASEFSKEVPEWTGGTCSGGYDGSFSVTIAKRDVTPEQFRKELKEWRAKL